MIPHADFHLRIAQLYADWTYDNPIALYGLIRTLKPEAVVECGTYRGLSASWMARALQENGKGHLYGIDNFSLTDHEGRHGDARAHLQANLQALGVSDTITIIEGDSDKVTWPDKVDFAYIDGWHSYLATKHDFEQCVKRGAECIAFDDTMQSVGPRKLMQDIRLSGQWDVMDVRRHCGMTIAMRCLPKDAITFSQELPNNPGVDLQTLTDNEQALHLFAAQQLNGVDYSSIIPALCPGRKE